MKFFSLQKHKKEVLITGTLLCCCVVAGFLVMWYTGGKNKTTETQPRSQEVTEVPEISLPGAMGELIALETLQTKLRIIYFWASWSPYTQEDLTAYTELQEKYGADVSVYAVSRDTNPKDGQNAITTSGLTGTELHFVYDAEDSYLRTLQGFAVPETIFIDQARTILHRVHGPMKKEDLFSTTQTLLTNL
jgi:peroxiredoxin